VGHVVVAAGVDAAADLDLQLADLLGAIRDRRTWRAMSWAIGMARALARAQ
jgi:hypothetical protein